MADVTMEMIKELRAKTGAGISFCKEALVESNGDLAEAELYMRKKDKDKAAKRSEKATGQGVVFVKVEDDGSRATLVEIACETDFVARNEKFQAFGTEVTELLASASSLDDVLSLKTASGVSLKERIEESVATIGENMKLKNAATLKAPEGGVVGFYKHFNDKAASLVALKLDGVDGTSEAVQSICRDVCMHITSVRPMGLVKEDIPEDVVAREKEVFVEEVKDKPAEIQDKIMMGKLSKFFASKCLAEQGFVKDESTKVKDFVASSAKAAGGSASIVGFVRFELGLTPVVIGGEKANLA